MFTDEFVLYQCGAVSEMLGTTLYITKESKFPTSAVQLIFFG